MAKKKSGKVSQELKNEAKGISNVELDRKNKFFIVSVNPKIYPLEVIYSAAYVFLDKAYVLIDGNPDEEIFVQMKPKDKKEDLERLGNEFNNELVNYAFYVVQAVRNQPLRKAIIERALMTNLQEPTEKEYCETCGCELKLCPDCKEMYCPTCESEDEETEDKKENEDEQDDEDEYIIDDPLGIAKPWKPPEENKNEEPENRQKGKKGGN